MQNSDDVRAHYKRRLRAELARLIGCHAEDLPTSVPKPIACTFLGLTNPKTLNVWNTTGRYQIVMFKMGRKTEPCTDWLITYRLDRMSISGVAV